MNSNFKIFYLLLRQILVIGFLTVSETAVFAQDYCLPSAPALTDDWDWRQNENPGFPNDLMYRVYVKHPDPVTEFIRSPFQIGNFNNDNIYFVALPSTKDYHPEDGWVLLKREFGKPNPIDPTDYSNYVDMPYFILYNKYRSLMRVFVYNYFPNEQISHILLNLRFWKDSRYNSALLSAKDPFIKALDAFDYDTPSLAIIHSAPNRAFQQAPSGYWLHGDFVVQFDPCTCLMPSENALLSIELQKVTSTNVQLTINGQLTPQDPFESVSEKQNMSFKDGVKALYEGYKAGNEFKDLIESGQDKQEPTSATGEKMNPGKNAIMSGIEILGAISPALGAVFGLFDLYISGGEETSQTPKPSVYNVDVKATGTLEQTTNIATAPIYLPGSALGTNDQNNAQKMVYNKPLGIFNLIKTPRLEWVDYSPDRPPLQATLRQYKVKEPLEYVINPHLDVEVVDIQASVIARYTAHEAVKLVHYPFSGVSDVPVTFLNSYDVSDYPTDINQRLATGGFEIDYIDKDYTITDGQQPPAGTEIRLRTPYVPLACFDKQSFVLSRATQWGQQPLPYFYTKLVIKLRRRDNPNAEPLIYVYTYEMPDAESEINDPPNQTFHWEWATDYHQIGNGAATYVQYLGRNQFGGDIVWPLPYYKVPYDLVIDYPIVGGGTDFKYAINSITIKQGATFNNAESLDYRAGNFIKVEPDVVINPIYNSRFYIDKLPTFFDDCKQLPTPLAQSPSYINSFCRDANRYKPKNTLQFRKENANFSFSKSLSLSAYPNPTTGEVWLKATDTTSANANVELTDLTGRVVLPAQTISIQGGISTAPVQVGELSSGVYLLKITVNGQTTTSKLVIQKE